MHKFILTVVTVLIATYMVVSTVLLVNINQHHSTPVITGGIGTALSITK